MNKLTYAVTRIIASVLIIIMLFIGVRYVTRNFLILKLGMDNAFTSFVFFDEPKMTKTADENNELGGETVNVDWEKLYPFENTDTKSSEPLKTNVFKQKIDSYTRVVDNFEDSLNQYATKHVCFYKDMVGYANVYEKNILWNIVAPQYNNLVFLDDGYMSSALPSADYKVSGDCVLKLNNFLQSEGIPFLYVQAPQKICEKDSIYGVLDFGNQNADGLLNYISQNGVNVLDLRKDIKEKYNDFHEAFFVTDHHWKPQTALFAASVVGKKLNSLYSLDIDTDIYNENNFHYDIYKNSFIGSHGIKFGEDICETEDFPVIYPNFATSMHITVPTRGVDNTGDYSITYYDGFFPSESDPHKGKYETFIYGNKASSLDNLNNNDGAKVLILGDSFTESFAPIFATGVSQVDKLDLRKYYGSVESYIKAHDFDVVIDMLSTSDIGTGETEEHDGVFDYR